MTLKVQEEKNMIEREEYKIFEKLPVAENWWIFIPISAEFTNTLMNKRTKPEYLNFKRRTNADKPRLRDGKIYLRLLQHEASKLLFVWFKMIDLYFKFKIVQQELKLLI